MKYLLDTHTFLWFVSGSTELTNQRLISLKMLKILFLSVLQVCGKFQLKHH